MSIIYCEKHDRKWDSDRLDECPLCESEPTIAELAQEIVYHADAMLRRGLSPHLYGTDRVTHVEPLAREVLRLAKLASELDPLDVYEKTIEIEKRWKQRATEAEAKLAAERKDAERYRWLRSKAYFIGGLCNPSWPRLQASDMPTLDAAIDRALKSTGK